MCQSIWHLGHTSNIAFFKSPTDLQTLHRITNMIRASGIQYPGSSIINEKVVRSYHIITLLFLRPVRVQGGNVLRTVPLPIPLLLAKEALRLALIGLALLGLTLCYCPSMRLHLLIFLLLVLLPLPKGLTTRRRPSHYIHRLLMELVILLKVLQQPQQSVVVYCRLCHSKMSKEWEEGLGQGIKDRILT